jgi:hypothetical protein
MSHFSLSNVAFAATTSETKYGWSVNELPSKHPVNGRIASFPKGDELAGQTLLGQHYLEISDQVRPILQSVIQYC